MGRVLAWSGGAAFAASLAAAGYVLAVAWPRAPAAPRAAIAPSLAWNAAIFALFAVHHSLLARPAVKRRLEAIAPALVHRTCYVWVASALLAVTLFAWRPIGHQVYTLSGLWYVTAVCAQLAGVMLIVAAGRIIDPLEMAGLRQARHAQLEARGPYLWVRHPIYLGLLLVLWATPTMTGDRLWFAAWSTLYLALAIPWEEASLRGTIGGSYDAYRLRVRWRIVPGLY